MASREAKEEADAKDEALGGAGVLVLPVEGADEPVTAGLREALERAVPEVLLLAHLLAEEIGEGQGAGDALLQALLNALLLAPPEALLDCVLEAEALAGPVPVAAGL